MKSQLIFGMFIIVSGYLLGCSSLNHQSPRYVKLANEITMQTGKKLKERRELCLIGTGGQMMHDIQMMAMSFNFYKEIDLKSARELIVSAINEYLIEINNNNEIKPFLHEYPFSAKNLEIRIWIYKPDGSQPPLDKIYYISAINGILTYFLDLPETYSRKAICEETYDEALQLMQTQ